jgi:hypothetical protein
MAYAELMDRSWAAGLFEGEGCICIHSAGSRRYVMLAVVLTMTDRAAVEEFASIVGGSVRAEKIKNRDHRQAFTWQRRGSSAAEFLRLIQPYVRTSRVREKIALALEYSETRQRGSRDPEYKARAAEYRRRMMELNRRGTLAHIELPDGSTVGQHTLPKLEAAIAGKRVNLLPAST